jgi:hypothetical protein
MGKTQQGKTKPSSPRARSPRSQKPQITERRKWCKEEDLQLQQSIQKYGTKNWCLIAANIPDRHPKQCRERWINHLDPQITKGKISEEEWKLVLKTHVKQGNRWSEIAKLLPGRTPNQIKNYWHTMTRRAQKRKREIEDNLSDESSSVTNEPNDYAEEACPENEWEQTCIILPDQIIIEHEQPLMVCEPQEPTALCLPSAEYQTETNSFENFRILSVEPSLYTDYDQTLLPWDLQL